MTPSVLVAGETLIDFIPDRSGRLEAVGAFSRRAGGASANVAVALARLDETPWFWTRVGGDPFGDFLDKNLTSNGIPERLIERDPEAKTTLAFVSHDEAGKPEFSFYREGTADTRMQSGTVPDDLLQEIKWVYLGGVVFSSEPSRTAMFDLTRRAQAKNCTIVFDPNARPELWNEFNYAKTVREVLPDVDIVKTTLDDMQEGDISAESPEVVAERLFELGPHTVFITVGKAGSHAFSTKDSPFGLQTASQKGYGVHAVDTTGAGDAFTAGVISALANNNQNLNRILDFANAVAAVTTTATGAMTALPDRETVDEFRSTSRK